MPTLLSVLTLLQWMGFMRLYLTIPIQGEIWKEITMRVIYLVLALAKILYTGYLNFTKYQCVYFYLKVVCRQFWRGKIIILQ